MNSRKFLIGFTIFVVAFELVAVCLSSPAVTPAPLPTLVTIMAATNTVTPAPMPTTTSPIFEITYWGSIRDNPGSFEPATVGALNLWTKIRQDDLIFHPMDWLADYAYEADGTLWMVGGFGVIKQDLDGNQTWYSMQNGLPYNNLSLVAISPSGEVWVGGANNKLIHLVGEEWINEGEKLPPPIDNRTYYLCYSQTISGIDFGPDGSAWVMNAGIEIYHQVNDQWVNIPFPKEILPVAGGGACPLDLRVLSDDKIKINLGPC